MATSAATSVFLCPCYGKSMTVAMVDFLGVGE